MIDTAEIDQAIRGIEAAQALIEKFEREIRNFKIANAGLINYFKEKRQQAIDEAKKAGKS